MQACVNPWPTSEGRSVLRFIQTVMKKAELKDTGLTTTTTEGTDIDLESLTEETPDERSGD